ncbi:tRNA-specific adenosine deaminase [Planctomyces bekefii]|uniref:tRNA-specific adenosine deaminase n=1 Tax=Planctomyces bekefii TaxID=1653850 RepID=A0A5C6M5B4_9PLAN|nr:tRNA-specific adenosine deaminase [Planctomyces bekefii]
MAENQSKSDSGEVPVASLVVWNNQIIGLGTNSREKDKSILGHAEINALQSAVKFKGSWNLSDCTIYVSLEPCAMCAGAILQAHIKTIVFSAYDIKSGAFGSRYNLTTSETQVIGGICEDRSVAILKQFFLNKRQ